MPTCEWRLIETAPKDGTRIVAIGKTKNGHSHLRATITRWHEMAEAPVYGVGWEYAAPGYCDLFEPTHWMPLPAPPETP